MLRSSSRSIQRTSCPKCGECPFVDGVCEQKIARGRRFFLLGALALPVAAKIESIGKLVEPAQPWSGIVEYSGDVWVYAGGVKVGDLVSVSGGHSRSTNGLFMVTKVDHRGVYQMKIR